MRTKTRAAVMVWCALGVVSAAVSLAPGCSSSSDSSVLHSTDIHGAPAVAIVASLVRNSQAPTGPIIAKAPALPGMENLVLGFLGRFPKAHAALAPCPTLTQPNPSSPPPSVCNGSNQLILHYPGVNETSLADPTPDLSNIFNYISQTGCSYAYTGDPTPAAVWFGGDNTLNFADGASCGSDPLTNTTGGIVSYWTGTGGSPILNTTAGVFGPAAVRYAEYGDYGREIQLVGDSGIVSGYYCPKSGGSVVRFAPAQERTLKIIGFRTTRLDKNFEVIEDAVVYTPNNENIPGPDSTPDNPTFVKATTTVAVSPAAGGKWKAYTSGGPIVIQNNIGQFVSRVTISATDPLVFDGTCCWPRSGTVTTLDISPEVGCFGTAIKSNLNFNGKKETITFGKDATGAATSVCGRVKWVSVPDANGVSVTNTRQLTECY